MVYEGNWTQTQQGTYMQDGVAATPPSFFGAGSGGGGGSSSGGGGFNWGMFAASAAQGIGASMQNQDPMNAYAGLGAGISAATGNAQSVVDDERKLKYMEAASKIAGSAYEDKLEAQLSAEREAYRDQLKRIMDANERYIPGGGLLGPTKGGAVSQGEGGAAAATQKIMEGLQGFRAGDRTEMNRRNPNVPESQPQADFRRAENAMGRQA